MGERQELASEPAIKDLLSEEITRLLMLADGVERHQVEALVARLGAGLAQSGRRKGVDS